MKIKEKKIKKMNIGNRTTNGSVSNYRNGKWVMSEWREVRESERKKKVDYR